MKTVLAGCVCAALTILIYRMGYLHASVIVCDEAGRYNDLPACQRLEYKLGMED